ncbi:hypothetical protein ACIHFB_06785 [Streptomyces sp. NPDC051963]|uniref:hypothetical protein n=1 Tax=Streptomyces sp. NPDC051963 TaxID=3365678 RepID=UPI0037D07F01
MAHTIPTEDLSPGQREWLGEVWDRLPFSMNGTTYRTVDEVLQDFEMPEDERVAEQATADRKWYREALAKYEAERANWEESYDEDPASEAEQKFAQDLYAAGYLDDIKLNRPLNPAQLGLGVREYEVCPTLPPGWRIRDALAQRSAEMFGDDQSAESAGCSLTVGAVLGGGKISHLFYDSVVNSIFGDRSAGKTWLALALAREFIERGEHVIWLNFEAMLGSSLRARLTAMGVEEARVAAYFHVYDRPDEAQSHTLRVGLVVIDAVDPCLGHNDWNTTNDSSAIDKMAKRYFYPYQETNPSVTGLTIDHIGNTEKTRESGSRRKQHYTQGVKYLMTSRAKSRKGTKGYSALVLSKDNNGEVPFDDAEDVAYVVLDSTRDAERIDVLISAHAPLKANESVTEQTQRKSARSEALRIIREAGVIDREDFNEKMKAAGYSLGNVRTQLSALKKDHLITVDDDVISIETSD